MKIGAVEVTGGVLSASVGASHNGSLDLALKLVDEAAAGGMDLIRFDVMHPDELAALRGESFKGQRARVLDEEGQVVIVDAFPKAPEPWGSQGVPMETFYRMTYTPHTWLRQLVKRCERWGIQWWATTTDAQSLATLESFQCPAYKLGASEVGSNADEIRARILDTGKPLIQSVPEGAEVPEGTQPLYRPDPLNVDLEKLEGTLGISYNGTDPKVLEDAQTAGAALLEVNVELSDVPAVYGHGRVIKVADVIVLTSGPRSLPVSAPRPGDRSRDDAPSTDDRVTGTLNAARKLPH